MQDKSLTHAGADAHLFSPHANLFAAITGTDPDHWYQETWFDGDDLKKAPVKGSYGDDVNCVVSMRHTSGLVATASYDEHWCFVEAGEKFWAGHCLDHVYSYATQEKGFAWAVEALKHDANRKMASLH